MTDVPKDLRSALEELAQVNALVEVDREVDPGGELATVLAAIEHQLDPSPVLFNSIAGYDGWRVAGSLFADRAIIAGLFGTSQGALTATLSERLNHPIAPETTESGPVHDHVVTGPDVSLESIPLVLHHERDAGRYISMGLTFVKDPETGLRNAGIYRFMQRDSTTLVPSLTSISNIADIFRRQEAQDEPLDIAIVPSASPAMAIAAGYRAALGVDECSLAGGLQESPMKLIPAKTVDVEVPADAELVIEARIRPGDRYPEAPFADMSGSYSRVKQGPLVEVLAITHRANPILQVAFSGHADTTNMAAIGQEIAVWRAVRAVTPNIVGVHIPASGFGFHCYMAVSKQATIEGKERGEQWNAMLATLGAVPQLKMVVAFDDDIDIFDDEQILRALARRFQPIDAKTGESRLHVIPQAKGATYDPSSFHSEYPNSKLMLDATIRSDLPPEVRAGFDEAKPPLPMNFDVRDYLPVRKPAEVE